MASKTFDSAKRRAARAQQHISSLQDRINAFFFSEGPYRAAIVEADPKTGDKIYKIKITRQISPEIDDMFVEAVESLRAALDHLAFETAVLNGASEPRSAYFPFANTATELENTIKGRCKDLPSEIISLFRAFKPYKGGNDLLWGLNQLCAIGKHRRIVALAAGSMNTYVANELLLSGGTLIGPAWDAEKQEMIVARTSAEGYLEGNMQIPFSIQITEIESFAGGPADGVLVLIAREVASVIERTEAECRRIGVIT